MAEIDRDIDRLELIVQLIDAIKRRLAATDRDRFLSDLDESDLTAFRMGHIGENAARLSKSLQARHPHLPWQKMLGLRNVVSHQYGAIDPALVWKTATEDLELWQACVTELSRLPS